MKYGDTLQQRSIPLWETCHATIDNVDYNDIKSLIKIRTTHHQGQGKAIPGSDNEAKQLQAFEDELYRELRNQHQRIDLFVQSKSGEIARRLAHLDKQITRLTIRTFAKGLTKVPIRRLEKFSRAETAALKAGEEIQSLSRFVGAQRLAFQKLLKKYKKWTGSPTLGKRFREEILNHPKSFSQRSSEALLAQWTEVLASVRAPFEEAVHGHNNTQKDGDNATFSNTYDSASGASQSRTRHNVFENGTSAARLHSISEQGSGVSIDTAFAILPLGSNATKAVYWVHPDNVVEIRVLLLQYTRLQRVSDLNSVNGTASHAPPSPRESNNAYCNKPKTNAKTITRPDEEVGLVILDDLKQFAKRCNSETISDIEERQGAVLERAAASIRFSDMGQATIVVGVAPDDIHSCTQPSEASLDRKSMQGLFDHSNRNQNADEDATDNVEPVSKWLDGHLDVKPLVQVQSRRSRFLGLKNCQTNGTWATLDTGISMRYSCREMLASGGAFTFGEETQQKGSIAFPYAILEVRTEDDTATNLMKKLDASHLTERVRGFSLETHAVVTLHKPQGIPRPFWLPALDQDIRKIPPSCKAIDRRTSQNPTAPGEPSTRHTSISASSTIPLSPSGFSPVPGESSATSAPDFLAPASAKAFKKKKGQLHRKQSSEKTFREPSQIQQRRYWNEFDDGSEGSDNEAYTIYVNPDSSNTIPGAHAFSKLGATLRSAFAGGKPLGSWLKPSKPVEDGQRAPLLNGDSSPSLEDSDNSDEGFDFRHPRPNGKRQYSTFLNRSRSPAARARETLLLRSCMASFAASATLLLVATILETTGRRKAVARVDAGVIIGVAASLVFACIGVGTMAGRKDDVGWIYRGLVFLMFALVVGISASLLAALG